MESYIVQINDTEKYELAKVKIEEYKNSLPNVIKRTGGGRHTTTTDEEILSKPYTSYYDDTQRIFADHAVIGILNDNEIGYEIIIE